jgi:DNA-binding MarR family transcriptional regulator
MTTGERRTQASTVSPREDRPEPPARTNAGDLLTELIIATFRLNALLMDTAQELAAAGGLTAAWWQVLGGVVDKPRSVADIGRRMGMSRQGVQRVADLLVKRGLAEYLPNPAHRRAKLLACTEAGSQAILQIAFQQRPWADHIGSEIGANNLQAALGTTRELITLLEPAHRTPRNRTPEDQST